MQDPVRGAAADASGMNYDGQERLHALLRPVLAQLMELADTEQCAFVVMLAKGEDLASSSNLQPSSLVKLLRMELREAEEDARRA